MMRYSLFLFAGRMNMPLHRGSHCEIAQDLWRKEKDEKQRSFENFRRVQKAALSDSSDIDSFDFVSQTPCSVLEAYSERAKAQRQAEEARSAARQQAAADMEKTGPAPQRLTVRCRMFGRAFCVAPSMFSFEAYWPRAMFSCRTRRDLLLHLLEDIRLTRSRTRKSLRKSRRS